MRVDNFFGSEAGIFRDNYVKSVADDIIIIQGSAHVK